MIFVCLITVGVQMTNPTIRPGANDVFRHANGDGLDPRHMGHVNLCRRRKSRQATPSVTAVITRPALRYLRLRTRVYQRDDLLTNAFELLGLVITAWVFRLHAGECPEYRVREFQSPGKTFLLCTG